MNYIDQYGRWHDRPSADSNNAWLYSAVAKKLGIKVKVKRECIQSCALNLSRHPDRLTPPLSRDEVLGLSCFGLQYYYLNGWNFFYLPLPKLSIIKLISDLIYIKGKHRNTWWKEERWMIAHLACSVPLKDRHFILTQWGEYSLFYHLIHIMLHFKQPKDRSSRILRWLKTGKDLQAIPNYFGNNHPFSVIANKKISECLKARVR